MASLADVVHTVVSKDTSTTTTTTRAGDGLQPTTTAGTATATATAAPEPILKTSSVQSAISSDSSARTGYRRTASGIPRTISYNIPSGPSTSAVAGPSTVGGAGGSSSTTPGALLTRRDTSTSGHDSDHRQPYYDPDRANFRSSEASEFLGGLDANDPEQREKVGLLFSFNLSYT